MTILKSIIMFKIIVVLISYLISYVAQAQNMTETSAQNRSFGPPSYSDAQFEVKDKELTFDIKF